MSRGSKRTWGAAALLGAGLAMAATLGSWVPPARVELAAAVVLAMLGLILLALAAETTPMIEETSRASLREAALPFRGAPGRPAEQPGGSAS